MDYQQRLVCELNRHHLESNPILVIAKEDQSLADALRGTARWGLIEKQAAMLDDIARSFTGDPMPGCGP